MINKLKLISIFMLIWIAGLCANGQPAAAAAAGAGASSSAAIARSAQEAGADAKHAHDETVGMYNIPNVRCIEYSPNGKWIAVVSIISHETLYPESLLQIFAIDPVTGLWNRRANFSLEIEDSINAITFSPNSSFLAICSGYSVYTLLIYSVNQNSGALSKVSNGEVIGSYSMAFSPNGRLLAIRRSYGIDLYAIDPDTGKPILPSISYRIYTDTLLRNGNTVSFSPDSPVLLASDILNSAVLLFKVHEGHTPSLTEFLNVPLPNKTVFANPKEQEAYLIPHSNLMVVQESSTKITGHRQGIAINEQGTGIEVFALKTEAQKTTLTPTDSMKFELTLKEISDGVLVADLTTEVQAYFNKNLVAMYQKNKKNVIHVVSIDTRTGKIHPFAHSPFTLKNNDFVSKIAFSPDNTVLAAVFQNSIQLYEIDEGAGTLTPLTGKPLHNPKERHKKAAEVLGSTTSPILPADIVHGPLYEYIVRPKQAQEKQITEDTQAKALNDAIAKTQAQRASKDADAAALFNGIKNEDLQLVKKHLTPFTINARSGELDNTPLMEAVSHESSPDINTIMHALLHYSEIIQDDQYHQAKIRPDLTQINKARNSSLDLAIMHKHYKIAREIILLRNEQQQLLSTQERDKALALAVQQNDQNDPVLKQIIGLLELKNQGINQSEFRFGHAAQQVIQQLEAKPDTLIEIEKSTPPH